MGMIALLTGLWAGLLRLGWDLPLLRPTLPAAHGPLMISGFLGTVISLERAVALNRRWAYAAPFLSGLGGLGLIAGFPVAAAQVAIMAGSLGLLAIFSVIVQLRPALYTGVMALGALVWFMGNLLWLIGWPIHHAIFWWAGFLLLTIVGERLELARLQQLSAAGQATFLLLVGTMVSGLLVMASSFDWGVRVLGAGMFGFAWWLGSYDIATRTVRQTGLTRFIALCLLSGYVWLGLSGIFALAFGGVSAGPHYDAMLHTFFLGFVFGMIFGHAPIIFPAVLGAPMTYRSFFYAHLILLQVTLIIRICGDAMGWPLGRQVGGLLNAITILLFLANTVSALLTPMKHAVSSKAGAA